MVAARPSLSSADETSGKDFKFVLIEKDNAPVRKETERLVTTKDTGKMFMSAAPATISGKTTHQWFWKTPRVHKGVPNFFLKLFSRKCYVFNLFFLHFFPKNSHHLPQFEQTKLK